MNEDKRTKHPFDWHEDGVLWLINRVVFHPRGFALTREPGGDPEWSIQGNGREPWVFPREADDARFAAVEKLLGEIAYNELKTSED